MAYSFDVKEELTPENIFKRVSEVKLWNHYAGDFTPGKMFHAPYRKDTNPSFNIFYSVRKNKYIAKDMARRSSWDIFDYIQMIYCVDFYTALVRINIDFGLNLDYSPNRCTLGSSPYKEVTEDTHRRLDEFDKKVKGEINIQIVDRGFNQADADYWLPYNIGSVLLRQYNVIPVKKLFINKELKYEYNPNNPCYAYLFPRASYRSKDHIKVYFPFKRDYRFLGNITNNSDIQGYDQCDIRGPGQNLVLTKSMKDVMCLRSFGIEAMAIHGETQRFNPDFIRHLRKWYRNIISLYDRDVAGVGGSKYLWDTYKISPLFIHKNYECKDISDLHKVQGKKITLQFIDKIVYEFEWLDSRGATSFSNQS